LWRWSLRLPAWLGKRAECACGIDAARSLKVTGTGSADDPLVFDFD